MSINPSKRKEVQVVLKYNLVITFMTIYDTNEFIRQINKRENVIKDDFVVVDFNVFEWLKGKDLVQQKEEFRKLDRFVHERNGTYLFRNSLFRKETLINGSKTPFEYKFRIAQKVCKTTSQELVTFCITTLFIVMTIVELIRNDTNVVNDEIIINKNADYEIAVINQVLKSESDLLNGPKVNKMAKSLFSKNKNETDLWFVTLYNAVAQVLNDKLPNVEINLVTSKHINLNDLFNGRPSKVTEADVEKYVNVLVNSNINLEATRKLYIKLISSILIHNKSFEFNHISDLYIQYVAEQTGAAFVSSDSKRLRW